MRGKTMFSTSMLAFAASAIPTACREPGGPYPTVTLWIEGAVTDADTPAVAIAGATVELWQSVFLSRDSMLARTTTNRNGHYVLVYSFTSVCNPEANTTDWLVAYADGYDLRSTYVFPEFSAPVIRCTSRPQVIDLSLHRRVIGGTSD